MIPFGLLEHHKCFKIDNVYYSKSVTFLALTIHYHWPSTTATTSPVHMYSPCIFHLYSHPCKINHWEHLHIILYKQFGSRCRTRLGQCEHTWQGGCCQWSNTEVLLLYHSPIFSLFCSEENYSVWKPVHVVVARAECDWILDRPEVRRWRHKRPLDISVCELTEKLDPLQENRVWISSRSHLPFLCLFCQRHLWSFNTVWTVPQKYIQTDSEWWEKNVVKCEQGFNLLAFHYHRNYARQGG